MKTTFYRVVSFLSGMTILFTCASAGIAQAVKPAKPNSAVPPAAKEEQSSTTFVPASPALDVTVAEIVARPFDYIGKSVAVVSELEQIIGTGAFKLDDQEISLGGIDNDLLVISNAPLQDLGIDRAWLHAKVRVTGKIQLFNPGQLQREYKHILQDEHLRRYANRPILIAQSIQKLPGGSK